MTKRHLVVLESPWANDDGDLETYSMRPFVEGLCELHEARLVYRTFTSGAELCRLLEYEAIDERSGRYLVYISSHGWGGRITTGRKADGQTNLANIGSRLRQGVEGVWLGACDLGASTALQSFLTDGGAVWAGGYRCSVDWDASLIVDLSVLQALLEGGAIVNRRSLVKVLANALKKFSPDWIVGVDGADTPVALTDAIRVISRERRARPANVTDDLRARLGWVRQE